MSTSLIQRSQFWTTETVNAVPPIRISNSSPVQQVLTYCYMSVHSHNWPLVDKRGGPVVARQPLSETTGEEQETFTCYPIIDQDSDQFYRVQSIIRLNLFKTDVLTEGVSFGLLRIQPRSKSYTV